MKPTSVIRVVIADDHDLFRDGLAAMLANVRDIEVLELVGTGTDALRATLQSQPDVLLLDVEMPGTPTLSVISRVAIESPTTRILIVTMHRDRVLATQMLNAGAIGFLSKAASSEELVDAIRQAQHRQRRVPPPPANNQILSQRELEVLRLIAEGNSNADIAGHLSIAIGTVKRHNSQIFTKLGASSRTDALRRARRLGELTDGQ